MDTLLSFSSGSSYGSWAVVGGPTDIADALDQLDDATYVWNSTTVVDDFFDLKLDLPYGSLQADHDLVVKLRAKVMDVGQQTCELTFELWEGDPSGSGSLVDDTKQSIGETWTTYQRVIPWALALANISSFDDLWLRLVVTKFLGGGDTPQPGISQLYVETPSIIKNLRAPKPHLKPDEGTYHVRKFDDTRVRKMFYDAIDDEWYDRDSTLVEEVRYFEVVGPIGG